MPPTITPPPAGSGQPAEPRRDRRQKPKPEPPESPGRVYSTPLYPPRLEAGTIQVEAPTVVSSTRTVAPVGPPADTRFSVAGGIGLLLFLLAAVLGLALATLPASMLSKISVRLAARRQEIGLAMAATLTTSAVIFVIVMAA